MKNILVRKILCAVLVGLMLASCAISGIPAQTPVIRPSAGVFTAIPMITIDCATTDADVRYTLDGTTPTRASTLYAAPFALTSSCTIQAVAFAPGLGPSETATAEYTLDVTTASSPIFSPEPEASLSAQTVTITCPMPGASIYYTTNETDPTTSSTAYTAPIAITSTTTIRARAFITGYDPSVVAEALYVVAAPIVGYPIFSPGDYSGSAAQSVTITCSTDTATTRGTASGAVIRYTIDGTIPTETSPLIFTYGSPITVSSPTVIQARCFRTGYTPSCVISANYSVSGSVAAKPVLSSGSGTYSNAQTVTITSPSGTAIYYSTTGGNLSTLYTGPLAISTNTTLRVRADSGVGYPVASAIVDAVYSFQVAEPTVTPEVLSFYQSGTAYLSCSTTGAELYYTTDGSTPTVSSTAYSASTGIPVSSFFTLRARAFRSGMTASHVLEKYCGVHNGGVAPGLDHSIAFDYRGRVLTWGRNDQGQLGDGSTTNRTAWAVVKGLPPVTAIAAGRNTSYALARDGTVWAWGDNSGGQIGDGTKTDRRSPVQVQGLSGIISITAMFTSAAALRQDGTVWAWGANGDGQLGDGTQSERKAPVQVLNVANAVGIAGGYLHLLINLADGTVMATGWNNERQLGDQGTVTDRPTVVQCVGVTGVVEIGAGFNYSIAVRSDNSLWGWGWGTDAHSLSAPLSDIPDAIAAGNLDYLFLTANSASPDEKLIVVGVHGTSFASPPLPDPVGIGASASGLHHFGILSDGSVWGWGSNAYGQLGDLTTTDRNLTGPVQVNRLDLW